MKTIGTPRIDTAWKRLRGASRRDRAEGWLLWMIDALTALWPQPFPPSPPREGVRLVSHRGEYDNRRVLENTIPAFDAVRDAGVWGIECDVRWTADRVPVVFHDPDLRRLYGSDRRVRDISWRLMERDFPAIPSLESVIDRYGGRLHLMIEVKTEPDPDPVYPVDRLSTLLSGLRPGKDYHFMTARPAMIAPLCRWGLNPLIPIAGADVASVSRQVLDRGLAGMAGHYLLMTRNRMTAHRQAGQQVGTGFINSRACLFREVHRGVDWLFSDRAVALQRLCRG